MFLASKTNREHFSSLFFLQAVLTRLMDFIIIWKNLCCNGVIVYFGVKRQAIVKLTRTILKGDMLQ